MSKTQVWGGRKKESSIKERRNKETGNQGYRYNEYDKTRPLRLVGLRLEVRKLWVLESEKKTTLTCSCFCVNDITRSNPRKSHILTFMWKMCHSRHHKCCKQCITCLYWHVQSFRTIRWRGHMKSGVSNFSRILPYLWPKTQVSEIKGKAWLEKSQRSRSR